MLRFGRGLPRRKPDRAAREHLTELHSVVIFSVVGVRHCFFGLFILGVGGGGCFCVFSLWRCLRCFCRFCTKAVMMRCMDDARKMRASWICLIQDRKT